MKKAKKHPSRRAPHMERYVKVERNVWITEAGKWRVRLHVLNQTFTLEGHDSTKREATFMRDMLCIALDNLVKDHNARQPAKKAARGS